MKLLWLACSCEIGIGKLSFFAERKLSPKLGDKLAEWTPRVSYSYCESPWTLQFEEIGELPEIASRASVNWSDCLRHSDETMLSFSKWFVKGLFGATTYLMVDNGDVKEIRKRLPEYRSREKAERLLPSIREDSLEFVALVSRVKEHQLHLKFVSVTLSLSDFNWSTEDLAEWIHQVTHVLDESGNFLRFS